MQIDQTRHPGEYGTAPSRADPVPYRDGTAAVSRGLTRQRDFGGRLCAVEPDDAGDVITGMMRAGPLPSTDRP